MARRIGLAAVWLVALLGGAVFVRLALLVGDPRSLPPPVTDPAATRGQDAAARPAGDGWRVASQLSAHHILVLEVETDRLPEATAIAQQLIEPVHERYSEVLVYFYRPGQRGRLAARRVQWTPKGGYVLFMYDTQN